MTEQPTVRLLHPTDVQAMADYSADCRDRLLGAGLPPTLHGVANCAGRQLEWLKPLVMGWRPNGGPVTGLAAAARAEPVRQHNLDLDEVASANYDHRKWPHKRGYKRCAPRHRAATEHAARRRSRT